MHIDVCSGKLKDKFDTKGEEGNAKRGIVKGKLWHLLLELFEFSAPDELWDCSNFLTLTHLNTDIKTKQVDL